MGPQKCTTPTATFETLPMQHEHVRCACTQPASILETVAPREGMLDIGPWTQELANESARTEHAKRCSTLVQHIELWISNEHPNCKAMKDLKSLIVRNPTHVQQIAKFIQKNGLVERLLKMQRNLEQPRTTDGAATVCAVFKTLQSLLEASNDLDAFDAFVREDGLTHMEKFVDTMHSNTDLHQYRDVMIKTIAKFATIGSKRVFLCKIRMLFRDNHQSHEQAQHVLENVLVPRSLLVCSEALHVLQHLFLKHQCRQIPLVFSKAIRENQWNALLLHDANVISSMIDGACESIPSEELLVTVLNVLLHSMSILKHFNGSFDLSSYCFSGELTSLSCAMQSNLESCHLLHLTKFTMKIVATDPTVKGIMIETGMLATVFQVVRSYSRLVRAEHWDRNHVHILDTAIQTLLFLTDENSEAQSMLHLSYSDCLIGFLRIPPLSHSAARLISSMLLYLGTAQNHVEVKIDFLSQLILVLKSEPRRNDCEDAYRILLKSLAYVIVMSEDFVAAFLECKGFELVYQSIVSLDSNDPLSCLKDAELVFDMLSGILLFSKTAKSAWYKERGYMRLFDAYSRAIPRNLTEAEYTVFTVWLLSLSTGSFSKEVFLQELLPLDSGFSLPFSADLTIVDHESLLLALQCARNANIEFKRKVFEYVHALFMDPFNLSSVSDSGILEVVLKEFDGAFSKSDRDPVDELVLSIVKIMASFRPKNADILSLFSKCHQQDWRKYLDVIQQALEYAPEEPSIRFKLQQDRVSCLMTDCASSTLASNGYSFCIWFRCHSSMKTSVVDLLTLEERVSKKIVLRSSIDRGVFQLKLPSQKVSFRFSSFEFHSNRWYNIVLTHKCGRLSPSVAQLYVDGVQVGKERVSYPTIRSSNIVATLGSIFFPYTSKATWHMKSMFLFESILSPTLISQLHGSGPFCDPHKEATAVHDVLSEYRDHAIVKSKGPQSLCTESEEGNPIAIPMERALVIISAKYITSRDPLHFFNAADSNAVTRDVAAQGHVQVYNPYGLAGAIRNSGTIYNFLLLIKRCTSVEELNRILWCIALCLRDNPTSLHSFDFKSGYKVIAHLIGALGSKLELDMESLVILASIAGLYDHGRQGILSNVSAFSAFFYNFSLWMCHSSVDVQVAALEVIINALVTNPNRNRIASTLRSLNPSLWLLEVLSHSNLDQRLMDSSIRILQTLLMHDQLSAEEMNFVVEFILASVQITDKSQSPVSDDGNKPKGKRKSRRTNSIGGLHVATFRYSSGFDAMWPVKNALLEMILHLTIWSSKKVFSLDSAHMNPLSRKQMHLSWSAITAQVDFEFIFCLLVRSDQNTSASETVMLLLKLLDVYFSTDLSLLGKFRQLKGFTLLEYYLDPFYSHGNTYGALLCMLFNKPVYNHIPHKELLSLSDIEVTLGDEIIKNPNSDSCRLPECLHILFTLISTSLQCRVSEQPYSESGNLAQPKLLNKILSSPLGKHSPDRPKVNRMRHSNSVTCSKGSHPATRHDDSVEDSSEQEGQDLELTAPEDALFEENSAVRILVRAFDSCSFLPMLLKEESYMVRLIAIFFHKSFGRMSQQCTAFDDSPRPWWFTDEMGGDDVAIEWHKDVNKNSDCERASYDEIDFSISILKRMETIVSFTISHHFRVSKPSVTSSLIANFLGTVPSNISAASQESFQEHLFLSIASFLSNQVDQAEIQAYPLLVPNIVRSCRLLSYNACGDFDNETNFSCLRGVLRACWHVRTASISSEKRSIIHAFHKLLEHCNRAISRLLISLSQCSCDDAADNYKLLLEFEQVIFCPENKNNAFFHLFVSHMMLALNKNTLASPFIVRLLGALHQSRVDLLPSFIDVNGSVEESLILSVGLQLLSRNDFSGFILWAQSKSIQELLMTLFEDELEQQTGAVNADVAIVAMQFRSDLKKKDSFASELSVQLTESTHSIFEVLAFKRQHVQDAQVYRLFRAKQSELELTKEVNTTWDTIQSYIHQMTQLNELRAEGLDGIDIIPIYPDKRWRLDFIQGSQHIRRKLDSTDLGFRSDRQRKLLNAALVKAEERARSPDNASSQGLPSILSRPSKQKKKGLRRHYSELDDDSVVSNVSIAPPIIERSNSNRDVKNYKGSPTNEHRGNLEFDFNAHEMDFEQQKDESWLWKEGWLKLLLEPSDVVLAVFNCSKLMLEEEIEGIIVFCDRCFYLIDGFRVDEQDREDSKGGQDVEEPNHDRVCKTGLHKDYLSLHKRFPYESVCEIEKRRYLLQPAAIELSFKTGFNLLLVFRVEDRECAFRNLLNACSAVREHVDASHFKLSLFERKKVELRDLTRKWQQGTISNFSYLMHLNFFAGRTFNDLNQYPVFPWVLQDYTSESIDLYDSSKYRDLSKPMGALNESRRERFQKRFESWDDPDIPRFHYGTHYSSSALVLSYLVRLEPFTQHLLNFQSGKFDEPDRMFHSLESTWRNTTEEQTFDVKELIPEFFFMPEFLHNGNALTLGKRSSGEPVNDVLLPLWCQESPREFVRLHQQALESPFVSAHLHHWIDLIFGYKQRGQAAVDAVNVFYYTTYEGSIDVSTISDPVMKQATIEQIRNFGQTPSQLFTKKHPERTVQPLVPNMFLSPVLFEMMDFASRPYPIFHISLNPLRLFPLYSKPIGDGCLFWGNPNGSLRIVSSNEREVVFKNLHHSAISAVDAADDASFVLTGGHDSIICVWKSSAESSVSKLGSLFDETSSALRGRSTTGSRLDEMELELSGILHGHSAEITHIALSRKHSIVASAALDNSVIVWDLNRLTMSFCLRGFTSRVQEILISEETGYILVSTTSEVLLWDVNGAFIARMASLESAITSIAMTCPVGVTSTDMLAVVLTGHATGFINIYHVKMDSDSGKYGFVHQRGLMGHDGPHRITSLIVCPDNEGFWSANRQGSATYWSIDPEVELMRNLQVLALEREITISDARQLPCENCSRRFKRRDQRELCLFCAAPLCRSCYLDHFRFDSRHHE